MSDNWWLLERKENRIRECKMKPLEEEDADGIGIGLRTLPKTEFYGHRRREHSYTILLRKFPNHSTVLLRTYSIVPHKNTHNIGKEITFTIL